MPNRLIVALIMLAVLVFVGAYALRFGLMEDGQWVGICTDQAQRWECQLRALLGLLIHFRIIAWLALGLALLGFCLPRKSGWLIAALALLTAIPALILYSASLAVFAVVLAALRLVRRLPATA